MQNTVEVKRATVHTFEGESFEVSGGVYLSPEAMLTQQAELTRLRERAIHHEVRTTQVVTATVAAAVIGFAVGFWFSRPSSDE